jgi:Tol biopolymer transport system component
MTSPRRFEQDLPILLETLYLAGTPDYRDDLVLQVAATRQRPAWTFPERWLPMDIATTRLPTARLPWRQLGVLALLALLIAAALAAYVGTQPRLPAPFGVAANGVVAYVDADGAIHQADAVTGQSRVIVAGPGNERPLYSPDGTRLAYLRTNASGGYDIVVARPDGQRPVAITTEALTSVNYLAWSPDSATIAISVPPGRLQTYDASTAAAPHIISVEGQQLGIKGFDDYNSNIQDLFRPPTGAQILFVGTTAAGPALFVADADGSNAEAVLDPARTTVPYSDLDVPQWSPDGTRIAVALALPDDPNMWRIHVLDADGTGLRELSRDPRGRSESHPSWSPDGTRIAFQRWFVDDTCGPCVTRPITVVGVDDGVEIEVGIINVDGYHGWSWSPDGRAIMEVAQNTDERRIQVAPLDGGTPKFLDVTTEAPPSWQRKATEP